MDPPPEVPYWIAVCFAKSSALLIAPFNRWSVMNAARLAVYELIRIRKGSTGSILDSETDAMLQDRMRRTFRVTAIEGSSRAYGLRNSGGGPLKFQVRQVPFSSAHGPLSPN